MLLKSLTRIETTAEKIELGWWLEIVTFRPDCIYYFGPFESLQEAVLSHVGYLEDLKQEGAKGITLRIQWCQPKILTSFCDEE